MQGQTLAIDGLVSLAQGRNQLGAVTATTHALKIHAVGAGWVTTDHDEGRNILEHRAVGSTHGPGAQMAELMHRGVAAQNSAITHMHMPGDGGVVGHDDVIAQHTVMGHMHISHQQIMTANPGNTLILDCATVQGAPLAYDVMVANDQLGGLTLVFLVLTLLTHRGKLEDAVMLADRGRAAHHHMRSNHGTGANAHIGTNQ